MWRGVLIYITEYSNTLVHVLQIFIFCFYFPHRCLSGAVFPDVDSVCCSAAVYGVGGGTVHTERTCRGSSQALSSLQRQESSELLFPDDIAMNFTYILLKTWEVFNLLILMWQFDFHFTCSHNHFKSHCKEYNDVEIISSVY